jgi:hypothetical protein
VYYCILYPHQIGRKRKRKLKPSEPARDDDASAEERAQRLQPKKKQKEKKPLAARRVVPAKSSSPSPPPAPPADDGEGDEGDGEEEEGGGGDDPAAELADDFVTAHRLANNFDYADGNKVQQFVPGKKLVLCLATGLGDAACAFRHH